MRTRSVLVVLALASFVTVNACKKAALPPVAPPDKLAPSIAPRADGIYAAKVQGPPSPTEPAGATVGVNLLRFTADGKVASLSVSSGNALETAVKLLQTGSDRAATGTYAVKDGVLRFTLTSKAGSVEYAGAIKDDQLSVRWRSAINDATTEEAYQFVKTDGAEGKAGAPEGEEDAGPGAPPPPAPPSGPTPPEMALIPKGDTWYCFRAPVVNTSRCERTSAQCESAYKEAATARPNLKLTKCAKKPFSFCHTAVRRGANAGGGFCYQSEEECKTGAAGFEGADLTVSTCNRF